MPKSKVPPPPAKPAPVTRKGQATAPVRKPQRKGTRRTEHDPEHLVPPPGTAGQVFEAPPVTPVGAYTHLWGPFRTRAEVRKDAARIVDNVLVPMLGIGIKRQLELLDKDPNAVLDIKAISALTNVTATLAQLGIGYVGANQIDPADIPNLPAPQFITAPADAPLPDGKAE